MNKKGDLSITTIVVAAISLLVLIVLIAVFTGQIGGFGGGVDSCASKNGACYDVCTSPEAEAAGQTVLFPGKTDCGKIAKTEGEGNKVCCIKAP